ncbi:MAG: hypothetical protein ACRC3I_06955 [Cetobacterium sp.]
MKLFNIFKKKEKKKESVKLENSSFSEATMNQNSFNASKEATIGREMMQEVLEKRSNIDIEKSKGWFFEAKSASSFNIDSAKKGSTARAVMTDSRVSSEANNATPDATTPHDIEIYENGIPTGSKHQLKAANDYKDAAKYQNEEKYKGMQRNVLKGQEDAIKNDRNLKITEETREAVSDKVTYVDKDGKLIESKQVELELVKNKRALKIDSYKVEVKETFTASFKTGVNASQTAFILDIIDDVVENREVDIKKNIETGVKSGLKAGGYTLLKDVSVNKMKLVSNGVFSSTMIALNVSSDLKKIYAMSEEGVPKETIREEVEALIYKAGVGYASKLALIMPGGAPASVVINYVGNKLIQKYLYSEIAMELRALRVENSENEERFKRLELKKINTDRLIEEFLALVEESCARRVEIVNSLTVDSSQLSIGRVSMQLTGKKVNMTTDEDLENLFDDELII